MKRLITALSLSALAAACAPGVQGGPPMPLPPRLVQEARVTTIVMSSDWLRSEDDFADTFSDEVGEELSACASGPHPLHLRVHVEDLDRAGRIDVLLNGDGFNTLRATAELVDPAEGGRVVGRFPLEVEVPSGGRLAGLVADRQMMVSEAFGRALCEAAFGRNPRSPGLHNATAG